MKTLKPFPRWERYYYALAEMKNSRFFGLWSETNRYDRMFLAGSYDEALELARLYFNADDYPRKGQPEIRIFDTVATFNRYAESVGYRHRYGVRFFKRLAQPYRKADNG